jgi:hypothetical protein
MVCVCVLFVFFLFFPLSQTAIVTFTLDNSSADADRPELGKKKKGKKLRIAPDADPYLFLVKMTRLRKPLICATSMGIVPKTLKKKYVVSLVKKSCDIFLAKDNADVSSSSFVFSLFSFCVLL